MENNKNLNIRPDKDNPDMIPSLRRLAKIDGRTVNNYVVRLLSAHIKRNIKKIK